MDSRDAPVMRSRRVRTHLTAPECGAALASSSSGTAWYALNSAATCKRLLTPQPPWYHLHRCLQAGSMCLSAMNIVTSFASFEILYDGTMKTHVGSKEIHLPNQTDVWRTVSNCAPEPDQLRPQRQAPDAPDAGPPSVPAGPGGPRSCPEALAQRPLWRNLRMPAHELRTVGRLAGWEFQVPPGPYSSQHKMTNLPAQVLCSICKQVDNFVHVENLY